MSVRSNNTESMTVNESSVFDDIITPTVLEDKSMQDLPTKQGWLEKKTTGMVRRWIRRYFVLEKQEIKYYYTNSLDKFGGVINFNIVTIDVQITNKTFKLIALGGKRAFKLRASSEQEALDWVYAISIHINSSNGRKTVLTIAGKNNFWKFPRISENEFKKMTCTGDLLLFRGRDMVSKFQRFVTKSEYDHVAMILKYSSGKIALFEATGADGVSIVYWDDFIFYQWEKLYSRLMYRKLTFERSEYALKELEEFIFAVQGKQYRISPGKLMSNKRDSDPKNKKGFFCSELIAMAYKMIGILPDDPPANKYWPGDFASSKNLRLGNGAYLHSEILIDFDIKEP